MQCLLFIIRALQAAATEWPINKLTTVWRGHTHATKYTRPTEIQLVKLRLKYTLEVFNKKGGFWSVQ